MLNNTEEQILVVEDDKSINDLLMTALTKNGYSVTQAWSGTEAVQLRHANASAIEIS